MTVRVMLGRGRGGKSRLLATRGAAVAVAAVAIAACGSGSTSPTASGTAQDLFNPTNFNTSTVSWLASNVHGSGTPVQGRTPKV